MNDELKRQLQSIDPMPDGTPIESAASPRGRRRLEEIMSTPITEDRTPQSSPSRTPWYLGIAAVLVAVVAIGAVIGLRSGESEPLELVAEPFDAFASCIVPSADVLARTELAFAGTVTGIDGDVITLTVDRWYAGGDGETIVTVTAISGLEALTGSVPWAVGGTFLVSATDAVVNYCGLSGEATPDLAAMYEAAFPA